MLHTATWLPVLCLGLEDIRWLRSHRNPVTRLAQGLRLAGLPYPGFVPHPVEAPHTVPGPHKPRPIRPHQPLQHLQPQRRSRTPTNPTPTPQTCPNPLDEVQPADLAQMISHPLASSHDRDNRPPPATGPANAADAGEAHVAFARRSRAFHSLRRHHTHIPFGGSRLRGCADSSWPGGAVRRRRGPTPTSRSPARGHRSPHHEANACTATRRVFHAAGVWSAHNSSNTAATRSASRSVTGRSLPTVSTRGPRA